MEQREKLSLLFSADTGEFQRVEAELLQVSQVELPRDVSIDVVEHDALVVEEAGVVGGDGDWDSLVEEGTDRMTPEVQGIPEDQVRNGAALYADLLLLNQFLQVGVESEVKAMTDTLGAEEDGIEEVLVVVVHGFTSVED